MREETEEQDPPDEYEPDGYPDHQETHRWLCRSQLASPSARHDRAEFRPGLPSLAGETVRASSRSRTEPANSSGDGNPRKDSRSRGGLPIGVVAACAVALPGNLSRIRSPLSGCPQNQAWSVHFP